MWRKKIYFLDNARDISVAGGNVFAQGVDYFHFLEAHTHNEDNKHVYWEFKNKGRDTQTNSDRRL